VKYSEFCISSSSQRNLDENIIIRVFAFLDDATVDDTLHLRKILTPFRILPEKFKKIANIHQYQFISDFHVTRLAYKHFRNIISHFLYVSVILHSCVSV